MPVKAAVFDAVIPIRTTGLTVASKVPLSLSDKISFRPIIADHLAIITQYNDEAASYLKGGSYTLTYSGIDPQISDADLNREILSSVFSLNVLGSGSPISLQSCFIIRTVQKSKLSDIKQIAGHMHGKLDGYEIVKGADLSYASTIYKACENALKKHPPLRITLSKYNSAMGRSVIEDQIIDLCVSLESIFQSQTEISFQFALYNSLLSEDYPEKRHFVFKTLKDMYSQRSNVVHGNKDISAEWATTNWDALINIAKTAILKKLDFLTVNDHNEWKTYLEKRALGIDHA